MACFQVNPSRLLTAAAEKCDQRRALSVCKATLTNTEHQRREPERIDCIGGSTFGVAERELQASGSDRREEGRNGREVEQVMCAMLLRESNGGDT